MRQLLFVLLAGLFLPAFPQTARSNPAALVGATGCAASGVCGAIVAVVVAGGATYYVLQTQRGRRVQVPTFGFKVNREPVVQPGPRPNVRPEVPSRSRDEDFYNVPGFKEVHWVSSEQLCRALYSRLRKQGLKFHRMDFHRANMPGNRQAGHCVLFGQDAADNRFTDPRYE